MGTDHGFFPKKKARHGRRLGRGKGRGSLPAGPFENHRQSACIYGEGIRPGATAFHGEGPEREKKPPLDNLARAPKAGVPILHLCGQLDPGLIGQ